MASINISLYIHLLKLSTQKISTLIYQNQREEHTSYELIQLFNYIGNVSIIYIKYEFRKITYIHLLQFV